MDEATGISAVAGEAEAEVETVYDLGGKRLSGMRKGVNIVKMSNGTTRKVVVK